MSDRFWILLGSGWLLAAALMAVLWRVQRRTGNAGIVDVAWAGIIGVLAPTYAVFGPAEPLPRVLIGAMGLLWGVRLAWHIHNRGVGKPEDGRYQQLRREWGERVDARMFRFYQFQAAAAAFFSLPFLLAVMNPGAPLLPLQACACALWLFAWIGESVADAQLDRFKRDPASRGRVCQVGLWRYSRHPNYFFEWIIWCAFALFALPAPHGAFALVCPALIFYFLFRVTGIPATEAQAVRSKGDAYREYQRTTSAFVPWPPRK